jgi:hypothetical protein
MVRRGDSFLLEENREVFIHLLNVGAKSPSHRTHTGLAVLAELPAS